MSWMDRGYVGAGFNPPGATDADHEVIVENVAGANGSIGTGRVVRAAPDGYSGSEA